VALAVALCAQARLAEAEKQAIRGEELRRQTQPEAAHLHALVVLAGIRARRGKLTSAAADLERVRAGLASFADPGCLPELAAAAERLVERGRVTAGVIFETPTDAELAVYRLLATDLSQREIGRRLYVSLNTVKTHTRSLYRKLGVSARDDAVARGLALGLIQTAQEGSDPEATPSTPRIGGATSRHVG
jgi:LuxR family maltose regulon positive regulatory protein